jgi:hypothetical protein
MLRTAGLKAGAASQLHAIWKKLMLLMLKGWTKAGTSAG